MSVVGDFTVPTDAFALEQALSAVPEMTVEADRLASHSAMEVMPFLWATGGDFDEFHDALESDPAVESVDIADETDDEVLYRLTWGEEFCDLINDMVDHHAAIVEASARDDHWDLRLRFTDESMVSSFQDHFRETGHEFEIHRLIHPGGPRQRAFGLTEDQREALIAAVQKGYFTVPRTGSMEAVGEALGISANAASQRVRRGCEALIRSGLLVEEPDVE